MLNFDLFYDSITISHLKGMFKISVFELLTKKIDTKRILCDEPMKNHTSFKVGGKADFYVVAKTIDEIRWVLEISNKYNTPLTVVGNGTNLLVLDNGIRGIVLRPNLNSIEINQNIIKAGAGALLSIVSKKASEDGLKGLEFAYGIPGTIGGAIRMNAGAYGREMSEIVQETTYINKNGEVHTITEHEFSYRNSIFSKIDVIILETVFKLEYGNKEEIRGSMSKYMESRKESQPLDMPNAGSTFKRGEGFITAKLIDEAGLKGFSIGGAEVSTKRAGFIVNKNNATASDILKLVDYVKKQVYEKFEKRIELEIIIIGDEENERGSNMV